MVPWEQNQVPWAKMKTSLISIESGIPTQSECGITLYLHMAVDIPFRSKLNCKWRIFYWQRLSKSSTLKKHTITKLPVFLRLRCFGESRKAAKQLVTFCAICLSKCIRVFDPKKMEHAKCIIKMIKSRNLDGAFGTHTFCIWPKALFDAVIQLGPPMESQLGLGELDPAINVGQIGQVWHGVDCTRIAVDSRFGGMEVRLKHRSMESTGIEFCIGRTIKQVQRTYQQCQCCYYCCCG